MKNSIQLLADRFSLKHCLGYGGMSAVYLARDLLLEKEIALKLIHPHLVSEPVIIDRFKREVAVSRTIRHPGIILIYDLFENKVRSEAFLTMEYLPGGSLRSRILEQGNLPLAEVIRIGKEALSALKSAHKKGIIHRDIKPHNFLFSGDGSIKLVDFGLARSAALDGFSSLTQLAGTPEYCAPEVVESGYADPRSDLYSLGITLYESITGKLPFVSNSPYRTLKLQVESKPVSPSELDSNIPREFSAVLLKALEKEPGERFQTASEFSAALDSLAIRKQIFIPETHPCPGCGRMISTSFPYCFHCSSSLLQLRSVRAKGYSILITGPGKPGDKFSSEKRYYCLELVKHSPVSFPGLEKQIPRLPFFLIKKLDKESARILSEKLTAAGIENIVTGPGLKKDNKQAAYIMNKKVFAMYPRILIIIFGSSGLWFQFSKALPVMLSLLAIFLLGTPLLLSLVYRRSQILWKKKQPASHLYTFLALAKKVKKPAFQAITRRLAEKAAFLEQRIAGAPGLDTSDRKALALGMENLIRAAAGFILTAEELDHRLSAESELALYRKIAALEKETETSPDVHHTGRLMEEKQILEKELETRRRSEQTISRLLDCLLRFSSKLDNLIINLAAMSTLQAGSLLPDLSNLVAELEIEAHAAAELEKENE